MVPTFEVAGDGEEPRRAQTPARRPPPYPVLVHDLSPGERRIVEMIGEGRTDAEIAVRLDTTIAAVKARIAALLAARGLSERRELLAPLVQAEAAVTIPDGPAETDSATTGPSRRHGRLVLGMALAGGLAGAALWASLLDSDEAPDPQQQAIQQAPVFDALSTEDELSMLDQSVRASLHEDGPAPWCRPPEDSPDASTPTVMGMVTCGTKP